MVKSENFKKNNVKILTARIFSKILYKTNFIDKKGNQQLLGTDILKVAVQKDLLSITILRIEEVYMGLLEEKDPKKVMQKKGKILFFQCIKKSCEDFLTQQYGYKIRIDAGILQNSFYTKNILKEVEFLFQVPFYILLDPKAPIFRLIYYPVYNFASENFIEALIDHMILEISNCVIYFNILKFSSVYAFRQTLYRSKFLSLRNFECFKNNLSWQLITKIYVQYPINLYNNCYNILIMRTNGICGRTIYANRAKELGSVNSFSLIILMVMELKDFIISRLSEITYFLSKSIRFTLTSIFGQVIGLIWRGVIDGLKK